MSLLGTGPMGAPIARNIIAGGVPLTLWNRTPEKAHAIGGGTVVAAAGRCRQRGCANRVARPAQVAALLPGEDGLLAGWKAAGIERSDPRDSRDGVTGGGSGVRRRLLADLRGDRHRRAAQRRHHRCRGGAAEHHGGRAPAAQWTASRRCSSCTASTVVWFGETGAGSTVKACNQIVVAATVTALCRGDGPSKHHRFGPRESAVRPCRRSRKFGSAARKRDRRWIDADFEGGGSAKNQLKDLRFITETAGRKGLKLPLATCLEGAFENMIEAGDGDMDHTGIYRTILT